MRAIDCHTHVLTEETMGLLAKEAPKLTPRLKAIDDNNAILDVAGVPYRPFPRGGFELERRFADMKASEVDMQVLSATPQTYFYEQEAAAAAAKPRTVLHASHHRRRGDTRSETLLCRSSRARVQAAVGAADALVRHARRVERCAALSIGGAVAARRRDFGGRGVRRSITAMPGDETRRESSESPPAPRTDARDSSATP